MRELEEVCANIRQALHEAFPPDGAPRRRSGSGTASENCSDSPGLLLRQPPGQQRSLPEKSPGAGAWHPHEIQVGHTDTGQLHNLELCSLLGNLLDNAIEACVPLTPTGEPVILVTSILRATSWSGGGKPCGDSAKVQRHRMSTSPPKQTRSATAWACRVHAASPSNTTAACSRS